MSGRTTPKGTRPKPRRRAKGCAPRILGAREAEGMVAGVTFDTDAVVAACPCGWLSIPGRDSEAVVGVPPQRVAGKSARQRAAEMVHQHIADRRAGEGALEYDKGGPQRPLPADDYRCVCGARPPAGLKPHEAAAWISEHRREELVSA